MTAFCQPKLTISDLHPKDFGELAFRAGLPASSGVVLFRILTPSPAQVIRVAIAALESRTEWAGHFAVV